MTTLLNKLRLIFGGSRRTQLLTLLFVALFLVLLAMLVVQLRKAYTTALPVGVEFAKVPGLGAIPAKTDRSIIVLNSYHIGYSWSDNEMSGIVDAILKSGQRIKILIEYLDCKRYPKMEHFDRLRDLLLFKYGAADIPLVIVADNPALQFALKYRQQLFPRAAIVFCGINGYTPQMIAGQANITGVAELLDADTTLKTALKLHPATRSVYVVHDYTITGLATRRETEEQIRPLAEKVTVRYVEDMPLAELTDFLKKLPADSIVLALSYSLDRDGNVVNHEKIARILSANAPVPVYGLHEERLGYGIVGGSLLGGKMQGARAAEFALRILGGEPASSLAVDMKSPAVLLFDHNQLVRFGISMQDLPPHAVVVNKPVSFIAEHPALVFSVIGMMSVLIIGIIALGINVYDRRVAEEERRKLQDQLLQAQKMEAVGHLAGGVAHDFNNILTAIIGYANLIRMKLPAGEPVRMYIDQVLTASERAVKVVRSLLAFSRKQVIDPKPTDLNEIVKGVEKIVQRLIGEDVDFTIILRGGSVSVLADIGQIEQVLMNLCTNARDAMPRGGSLSIETDRVVIDADSLRRYEVEREGVYGVIVVSDTGSGMSEEVRRQIFEPFFTTKEVGKGTGLGLSIAYGIIKQHGGTINAYSEPGKGTTFKIYLPVATPVEQQAQPVVHEEVPKGSETVLLAEDDPEVRGMIALVLSEAGYRVIEAVDGEDAVRKFQEHSGEVRLLLTDLIMPKLNGGEVFDKCRAGVAGLKVLFLSGYTADIIKSRGIIENGRQFLSKPVAPDHLLRMVRQVLDAN